MAGKLGVPIGVLVPNLRERRIALGLSQRELAERSGIKAVTIGRAEKGKHIRKKNAEALVHLLGMNGSAPPAVKDTTGPPETEESLVVAFKLLIEELDKHIDARMKRFAVPVQSLEPRAVIPPSSIPTYVPPPAEPDVVLPQASAVSHGFPVTAALNNWTIRYERKFLKEYEVSGLEGPIRSALQKFAMLGEQYSGLGFKKMDRAVSAVNRGGWKGARYEFRVNRRWRVLLRRDSGDKAYTITRLAHHDEVDG